MCSVRETVWSHGIKNGELAVLSERFRRERAIAPTIRQLLSRVAETFPERGLRPPVSALVILTEQLAAIARGDRSELGDAFLKGTQGFAFAAYQYHWEGGVPVEAVRRYVTPLWQAIHEDLPTMLMSFRLKREFDRITHEVAGTQIVAAHCCGSDCVPADGVDAFLSSPMLERLENARARATNVTTFEVASVWDVPADVLELGRNDRVLHDRVQATMTALCGPIARAGEPLAPRRLAIAV